LNAEVAKHTHGPKGTSNKSYLFFGDSLACRVFLVFSQGITKEREKASFRKIKIQKKGEKGCRRILME